MSIFDDCARHGPRPRRQNEGTFDYLNASARPGICAIRELINGWFDNVPDDDSADLRGRLRSRDEIQHQSAFFELFWHELLRRSGYDVKIHPPVPNAETNPDFLASRNGEPLFYVEATLAVAAEAEQAIQRRIAEVHDTLDRMESPDYFWEFQVRGSPRGNIRGRVLRERLIRWSRMLNFDEISRLYVEHRYSEIPTFAWSEPDFVLSFTPIPKSEQMRGQCGVRPVGVAVPGGMRLLHTHDDIRAAVEGKATKYGDIGLPMIVAVNVMEDFCDDEDVLNALFGEKQIQGARVPNGVWRDGAGARNRFVSAVVVTRQLMPSTLRSRNVVVIHNPWAILSLPLNYLALPQETVCWPSGEIEYQAGATAAEVLGVPHPWPVPD